MSVTPDDIVIVTKWNEEVFNIDEDTIKQLITKYLSSCNTIEKALTEIRKKLMKLTGYRITAVAMNNGDDSNYCLYAKPHCMDMIVQSRLYLVFQPV